MLNVDDADFGILAKLRQEFIDVARNQLDGIDKKLDQLDSAQPGADEVLHSIQRDIHNIMG